MSFKKLLILIAISMCFLTGAKEEKSRFQSLELFNKVLHLVESQYYRDIDMDKLIEGALKGMMNTLDPHSAYLGKDVFAKMQEDTQGEFGGLGIEVTQKDGILVVISPMDDTPAFRAGIKSGDKIVEINHESTMGINLEDAVDKMRGKAGEPITIGIIQEGVEGIKQFTLKREIIKIKPVKSEMIDTNYLYLRLSQFQKRAAENMIDEIQKANKNLNKKGGVKGIIFDLRSNPGGLLDEAIDVSSIFLKDGVVVSTESRDPKAKEIKYVKKSGFKDLNTPLVLIVDGSSASASEIVAGALQDHHRAIVMGTRSFGKGSVQTVARIDDEKAVKLTISQYMTPSGKKIQAIGIVPDINLDLIDGPWSEMIKDANYIREKDLRNHLTATIETSDEKELRIEDEKKERLERIQKIKQRKDKLTGDDKKEKKNPVKYDPQDDYQVIQAVNILKGFKLFKKLEQ